MDTFQLACKMLMLDEGAALERPGSWPVAEQPTLDSECCYSPGMALCIPAYNEEQTIERVVREADETLQKTGMPGEVLVLDDCSTDRTWEILKRIERGMARLRVRRHAVNRGIMQTFEELYQWSHRQHVFLNSADEQWRMEILLAMLPLMNRYDVVVARRVDKHYGLGRRIISWAFNTLPVLLFGTRTYDAGSVKLARREFYNIKCISTGVFVEAERIVRASRRGLRIGVIDVSHAPRKAGKASGANLALILESIIDLGRCWIDIVVLRRC